MTYEDPAGRMAYLPSEDGGGLPLPMRHLTFDCEASDLGGRGGASIWRGRLFRSSELAALTPSDIARLELLGLAVVFDLRSNGDRLTPAL
jgi:hypothetical protein